MRKRRGERDLVKICQNVLNNVSFILIFEAGCGGKCGPSEISLSSPYIIL